MKEPLISIVVPIYKVEPFLRRCIDSIQNQTYKNLEIILVDDGSPDKCGMICDEYAQKDSRIQVIHKKNGGLSDARNAGIAIAKGEYIGFVDSDDYIQPNMYKKLLRAALTNDVPLAMCAFFCEDECGAPLELNQVTMIPDRVMAAREILELLPRGNGWFFVVAWNKLYHRSLLNPDFYPFGKYHEDEFVIAPLLLAAQRIACISVKSYHYVYLRNGSITGSNTLFRHLDALEALYERCVLYHNLNMDDLIVEHRAFYFAEMEQAALTCKNRDKKMKLRLKEIQKMYSKIPGRRRVEDIKFVLFQISPRLEYWLTQKSRQLRFYCKHK